MNRCPPQQLHQMSNTHHTLLQHILQSELKALGIKKPTCTAIPGPQVYLEAAGDKTAPSGLSGPACFKSNNRSADDGGGYNF